MTWSPENNPYEVIHNIYVDSGVTLTILPGTVVKFHAALSTFNGDEYNFHFYYVGGESVAKMIYAFGRIVALGTEADSITFTRYEEAPSNMRWGNIIFSASAPKSTFRHCRFMYSHNTHDTDNNYFGALCSKNGRLDVSYCRFFNCDVGVFTTTLTEPMLIHHNLFQQYERPYEESWFMGIMSDGDNSDNEFIVAYNSYRGKGQAYEFYNSQYYPVTRLFEKMSLSEQQSKDEPQRNIMAGDCYGNQIVNSTSGGTYANSISMNNKGYVKRNTVVNSGGLAAVGYMDVCDNVMINSNFLLAGLTLPEMDSVTDVYNNWLDGCRIIQAGGGRIFNNVIINSPGPSPIELGHHTTLVANNTVYNTPLAALYYNDGLDDVIIENNIFNSGYLWFNNEWIGAIFRNNVMNFAVPALAVDGGGNLIGANPLFADPANGNLHLLPGSPCIDAGYDTTGYYAMDFDYYHRVVDGTNDGIYRIDIGAYEYGSSFLGGFDGHIYLRDGSPLSLAKVDINDVTREYTDSLGYFRFSAPAGTYALNVHHIFEGDCTFEVTINEGQFTTETFTFLPTGNEDNTVPELNNSKVAVFPNPVYFRDTKESHCSIEFTLPTKAKEPPVVEIYNLKGQKVRSLNISQSYNDLVRKAGLSKEVNTGGEFYSTVFDCKDMNGRPLATGIYLIRVKADGRQKTAKLTILR
jgi:hypothetical protein